MTHRAAPRDASWYRHPDTSRFKVVHVDNGDEFAACDSRVPLGVPTWADAADVPRRIRCRRTACSRRFYEADAAHRSEGRES